jgi:hypothetical protein
LPLLAEDHRMDVAAWLRDLGLERYVSAFRDNDIDAEVLPKLTAEDLISIGVTSVGPPAQADRGDCRPRHGGSDRRGGGARPWCTGTS